MRSSGFGGQSAKLMLAKNGLIEVPLMDGSIRMLWHVK